MNVRKAKYSNNIELTRTISCVIRQSVTSLPFYEKIIG